MKIASVFFFFLFYQWYVPEDNIREEYNQICSDSDSLGVVYLNCFVFIYLFVYGNVSYD